VKRIHATYTLQVDDDADRDRIERAHRFHAAHCPVARSIRDAIEVSTSYDLVRA
jgi:uncharacterized OsmC-like protein